MTEAKPTSLMRLGEFVPLVALIICLVALSIDAMLPALPAIGRDLGVTESNDTQLVVSSLLLGLGLGQLFYGPLSDSIGRKPAIFFGLGLFMVGCVLSILAHNFQFMLVGRVLQGVGAAGPRVVTIALVRDQYAGADMARVMSFVMAVFIMVPVLAPALGQGIAVLAGWRAIFVTFLAIATIGFAWLGIRQPETLPPERRAPFSVRRITGAVREIVTTRAAIGYTLATGLVFVPFLGYLNSAQQIFQDIYLVGGYFPLYFAVLALAVGAGSVLNSRLVALHGMKRMVLVAAATLTALSAAFWMVGRMADWTPPLWLFMSYMLPAFVCLGILMGNLNALAMQPLGHIAGVGAALVGALSTFIAVPFGAFIGRSYDGTIMALVSGFLLFGALALGAAMWAQGGASSPYSSQHRRKVVAAEEDLANDRSRTP